jgi:hypothetical protein
MSLPDKIRIFLKADDTTFYYVDGSGTVQTEVSPANEHSYRIKDDPDNLEDLVITWSRNLDLFGIFRGAASAGSAGMQFVGDGCRICQHVFYSQGFNGKLFFLAEELRGDSSGWDVLYSGRVDFKKPDDQIRSFFAQIIEGGLASMIESNFNTPYKIPVPSSTSTPVYADGIDLQTENNFRTADNVITPVNNQDRIAIGMTPGAQDVTYTSGTLRTVQALLMPGAFIVNSAEYENWMFKAQIDCTISVEIRQTIKYQFFTADAGFSAVGQIWLVILPEGSTTASVDVPIWIDPAGALYNVGGARTVYPNVIAAPYSLNKGDQVYLEFRVLLTGGPATHHSTFTFYDGGDFSVYSVYRLPPSIAYGHRPHEIHEYLTAAFTDNAYTGISDHLSDPFVSDYDSTPYQVLYVPSDSLRQLDTNTAGVAVDPMLTMTPKQFFDDVHGRWLVGMGINANSELFIEHLSRLFDKDTLTLDVGEMTDISIGNATEYIFGQFTTGHGKQSYDKQNGRDEPITASTWKLPDTIFFEPRDFLSPFRADPTGIEFIRANLSKKKFIDAESDNDTFLIAIETPQTSFTPPGSSTAVNAYNISRPNNSGNTSGVFSPDTIYNISLTPARDAYRLGPLIHSIAWKEDGKNIAFQKSEKNEYLTSDIGSGPITENDPIPVSNLGNKLFKPLIIKGNAVAPTALAALIAAQPYGYIRGTSEGREIKGFIMDVSRKPFKETTRQWVLLATPDFDETQFQ